jgi:hypothetical protein
VPSLCPPGKYGAVLPSSSSTLLTSETTACSSCPQGKYCDIYGSVLNGTNNATKVKDCPEGYVCRSGAKHVSDLNSNQTIALCGRGKYCPSGTSVEINCPVGTYNPMEG